jgi:HD-GYP domain-containing protein (c-di-GMP phosphodiesterase class II)
MSPSRVHLVVPERISPVVQKGTVHQSMRAIAAALRTELVFEPVRPGPAHSSIDMAGETTLPIRYRGEPMGRICWEGECDTRGPAAIAPALRDLLEHILERELAIDDLAGAMLLSYEELNMFHNILSNITFSTEATAIGKALVDETARALNCRRVSLLVFNEDRTCLNVLASKGLPPHAREASIPVRQSVSGRVLEEDGLLVVNDITLYPGLERLSRGTYESDAFVIIRIPLHAHGESIGVLTATEKIGIDEFTTRDRKLFEGLSSVGASALLNCRLHEKLNRQMMATIQALATAVDAKDHYTHSHSARVAELCVVVARRMSIVDSNTLREIRLSGLLHDIGKIGVPERILGKPSELSSDEYVKVKEHVEIGSRIIEQVPGLEAVASAVLHHHERYDGLGYPAGLAGRDIPFASRLISAADVFDTLTSERPYRKAISVDDAIRELQRSRGTQQDPSIVDAMVAHVRREKGCALPEDAEPSTCGHVGAWERQLGANHEALFRNQ